MRNTFTIEAIKETATYRSLESKNEIVKCNFLQQKSIRERITHAFYVWKNTGRIPNTVNGYELLLVEDLIKMQGPDYSSSMTAEDIHGTDND